MIDYREGLIRINGFFIYIDERNEIWADNPDKKFTETAFMTSNCSEKIDQYKKQFTPRIQQLNQSLGTIPNQVMNIELTSKTPISKKPFKIPYKLREPIQDEINRLLGFKIIRPSKSPLSRPAFPF